MSDTLYRIGDFIHLSEFHKELLETMTDTELTDTVSVTAVKELLAQLKEQAGDKMQYGGLMMGFLSDLEALCQQATN